MNLPGMQKMHTNMFSGNSLGVHWPELSQVCAGIPLEALNPCLFQIIEPFLSEAFHMAFPNTFNISYASFNTFLCFTLPLSLHVFQLWWCRLVGYTEVAEAGGP